MFNINDFWGLREVDVFGLMYDYKKIISTGIQESHLKNLKKTFAKYSLKFTILDPQFDFCRQSLTYLISKKTIYLEKAKKAYEQNRFDIVGYYLGYPRCCIDFYYRQRDDSGGFIFKNFIKNIYANSDRLFWKLNNILNFDGRLKITRDKNYFNYEFMSFIKRVGFISLISHNPCSYDCRKSLKIAELNYKYSLLHHNYNYRLNFTILKKPILYINDFHFVIFEGYSKENYIQYNKVLLCLDQSKLKNSLFKGDQIKVHRNFVTILCGKKVIDKIRHKNQVLILPFDKAI